MSKAISADAVERRMAYGEIRADLSEDRKIRGYAIVFNRDSVDLGGFIERIRPEAVDRSLRDGADIRALVDHDSSKVIGRTRSGTLQLRKDSRGLRIEIDPPNTTVARDILESISRGDVTGMSFSFKALEDDWHMEDGMPTRDVLDMEMREVSIVSFPAYPDTDVQVAQRSLSAFKAANPTRSLDFLRRLHKTRLAR